MVLLSIGKRAKKCKEAKLHLFNETMTDIYPNYLGLYTMLNIPENCYSDLELECSGNFPYTEENADKLMRICCYLESQSIRSDIILFSDNIDVKAPESFTFIGYNICADSEWYSPLGDGLSLIQISLLNFTKSVVCVINRITGKQWPCLKREKSQMGNQILKWNKIPLQRWKVCQMCNCG